jgi:hypothetical protein
MLLLTLLLSNNRVHGFGTSSVSMNNPLLPSRMVTQGYSLLTRTHSERNDKAFLPWNMARTPTTTHAHDHADADADADAEGSPAFGNYELMEMMRSMLESQRDMLFAFFYVVSIEDRAITRPIYTACMQISPVAN